MQQNGSFEEMVLGVYESSLFLLLSASLAEVQPLNATYLNAATQSLEFVFQQAVGTDFMVPPNGNQRLLPTPNCPQAELSPGSGTSGLGAMVEAISIMHSMTGNHDMGVRLQQAIRLILDALENEHLIDPTFGVLLNKEVHWDDPQDPGSGSDGDMYLLRGLAEARRRGEGVLPAELLNNMTRLLGSHYNAIRDYAAPAGVNVYSRKWVGPRPTETTFDLYNQVAAAQILVDGIDLFNGSNPGPSNPTPSNASHKPLTAVIAGVTVGSVALILLIAFAAFYAVQKWHCQRQKAPSSQSNSSDQVMEPFVATTLSKTTAFLHKCPAIESQAQTIGPEAQLTLLRRHNSAPSTFQAKLADPLGGCRDITDSFNPRLNTSGHSTCFPEYIHTVGETEIALPTPDLVCVLYERLWPHSGSENPPDYHSNSGESSYQG
ncbi:hypothetical protein PM082_014390 [Marasmius tenuissimus]|nr:hypothetical protein PM082_014390 [Marasmius tenuissimus]